MGIIYKGKDYSPSFAGVSDVRVNGESVVHNNVAEFSYPVIHISPYEPTPDKGVNGDIWLVYDPADGGETLPE